MNKQKFNQASWNYPEETEILVIGNPNKQCLTCNSLKVSNPTPDGDEICPDCGGDCMDYEEPNKQKTDWEKTFDKTFLNIRFNTTVGTSVNIKDFISNLLQQQREYFKQTMANSNEWWNNKLRQQREEIIKEIEGIVKENRKGTFTDEGGNDCWYIDDLVKELKILEKK